MESMDGGVNRAKGSRNSQATLWWIMAVCVLPVAASTLMWWSGWTPQPKTQAGVLIQPVIEIRECLRDATVQTEPWPESLQHKWVLLIVEPGVSEGQHAGNAPTTVPVSPPGNIEKRIYLTQQLKTMQGKHRDRVVRARLSSTDKALSTQTAQSQANNQADASTAQADGIVSLTGKWCGTLPAKVTEIPAEERVYVVDPHGNVMMVLDARATPKALHKDLTRLLTVSRIG